MNSRIGLLVASFFIAISLLAPTHAAADEQIVSVKSNAEYKVHLKFFSQDYNRTWPGPDSSTVWVLADYARHTYNLSCRTGEKICYGAWVAGDRSEYWGVGASNRNSCTSCCFTCGNGDVSYTLEEDD